MNRVRFAFISLGLVLLSAAVSFGVFTALYQRPAAGVVSGSESDGASIVRAASLEEASRLAGYQVVAPAFLPQGFRLRGIAVVQRPDLGPGEHRLPPDVTQVWINDDAPGIFIQLMQDPITKGLGGGEPAFVAGVQGQRSVKPATAPDKLPYVSFFWRKREMSFLLTGALGGPVTEDTLLKTAESVPEP